MNYGQEGYIYHVYGHVKYLQHAIASATTIRRYDRHRKIVLICEELHRDELQSYGIENFFDAIHIINPDHKSITGFKHNVHQYHFFDRSLFLDSDIIWCKNPDPLWKMLHAYDYTITGNLKADAFFGAPKGFGVLKNIFLKRRERTLKRFGINYLSRVQSGLIFVQDAKLAKKVCETAAEVISRMGETHFQSRGKEQGRTLESCEWSLAMAMSLLNVPVFTWQQGHTSPQLDYIEGQCFHNEQFTDVKCKVYTTNFVYSLRGLKNRKFRSRLISALSYLPGFSDYMVVQPFCIHFGWLHQKKPFYQFSEQIWRDLIGVNQSGIENFTSSDKPAQMQN